jgi:hypothetical protein
MDQPTPSAPFWDSVRAWADSMGLLFPQQEGPAGEPVRPRVPQSVCDSCPICQGAATLDQVNPDAIAELADVARALIGGIGSALASAAEQRLATATSGGGDRDREEPDGSELPPTGPSDADSSDPGPSDPGEG